MNRPSSTITAAALGGAFASVLLGLVAAVFPDIHGRLPGGFEAGLAVLFTILAGWLKKENVLRAKFQEESDG